MTGETIMVAEGDLVLAHCEQCGRSDVMEGAKYDCPDCLIWALSLVSYKIGVSSVTIPDWLKTELTLH